MQQLVDEPLEGAFDFFARPLVDVPQFVQQAAQFVALEFLGLLLEAQDGRAGDAVVHIGHEASRFFGDDLLGFRPFLFALGGSARTRSSDRRCSRDTRC